MGSSLTLGLCCRHSVTALALTADDTTAYSVSKDGRIVQMHVESGEWCAVPPFPFFSCSTPISISFLFSPFCCRGQSPLLRQPEQMTAEH